MKNSPKRLIQGVVLILAALLMFLFLAMLERVSDPLPKFALYGILVALGCVVVGIVMSFARGGGEKKERT